MSRLGIFRSSFGLMPAQVLNVRSPLPPNQSASASLPLNTQGPVQKMDPLGTLQVRAFKFGNWPLSERNFFAWVISVRDIITFLNSQSFFQRQDKNDYKNLSWVWDTDRKVCVRGSMFGIMSGITRLCWVMANSDPEGWIFLSALNNHDKIIFHAYFSSSSVWF